MKFSVSTRDLSLVRRLWSILRRETKIDPNGSDNITERKPAASLNKVPGYGAANIEPQHRKIEQIRTPVIRRDGLGKIFAEVRWRLNRNSIRRKIIRSRLFEPDWYVSCYPDVPTSGMAPIDHYLRVGWREDRNPHPLFDTRFYRAQADVAPFSNALIHYLMKGYRAGFSPSPMFDPGLYRAQLPDLGHAVEPLGHYLAHGAHNGKNPNRFFDTVWYLDKNRDVRAARVNPLLHYVEFGWKESRNPHPRFSTMAYLVAYPELAIKKNVSPLHHSLVRDPAYVSLLPAVEISKIFIEEYGEACARRVISYFGIVFDLESRKKEGTSRAMVLSSYVERQKVLANMQADNRSVEVSIIIPAFNHVEYTLACVQSILEHSTRYRYEIIIGNDRSEDETEQTLAEIGGVVRVVTHAVNGGFIRNCNQCAEQALGRYIVLLNNDTFVLNGWLDALIEPFEKMKMVGLVGSKLLLSDGRLQEAGGILWKDGNAWNFGRNQDPSMPEYNYLKDVDYISGASVAVPKAIWKAVGGLDERYVPAYYDDADLAFTLRSHGYRTIYQPFSAVIHHEGISHGTDTNSGGKSYQVANARKFFEKWNAVLTSEHFPNGQDVFVARDRSARRPHILVVDHYVPEPDKDAGSRSMFDYLKLLVACGFQVTFLPDNRNRERHYARFLQNLGIEVLSGPGFANDYDEWIRTNGKYFQYAFLSRAHIAKNYLASIRSNSKARILFYGHDISALRLEQELAVSENPQLLEEIKDAREVENLLWEEADVIYYPAEFECKYVRELFPKKAIRQIPLNIIYPQDIRRQSNIVAMRDAARHLLFVGGFRHRPNTDAMLWFYREVLPRIRAVDPNVLLQIVGSFPPPEVIALASDNIVVTDYVPNLVLELLYRTSLIVVVPLRFGGGVKGKVLEAFRQGIPVVSTSIGLQGLSGAELCVELADDAKSFADAVIRLLNDPSRRLHLADQARAFVAQHFSPAAAIKALALDIPELCDRNYGENT